MGLASGKLPPKPRCVRTVYILSRLISQAISRAEREPTKHFAVMPDAMIKSFTKDGGLQSGSNQTIKWARTIYHQDYAPWYIILLQNHYFEWIWKVNSKNLTYIDPHDLTDGCINFCRVIEVHSDDMRPANILLCIWMLRGHLREEWYVHNPNNITRDIICVCCM